MRDELRVLCVCTHNRTRSVMTAALLDRRLAERGVPASVRSAGIRGEGEPPTEQTVRLLAQRGIDVAGHRSRRVDGRLALAADLIVTAEHEHVVYIAGHSPDLFLRTFTLPELVLRGEAVGARDGAPIAEWLARIGEERPTALDYLDAGDAGDVEELADPTGQTRRHWTTAITDIDDLTTRLAALLA